jgi:hypothetical protein
VSVPADLAPAPASAPAPAAGEQQSPEDATLQTLAAILAAYFAGSVAVAAAASLVAAALAVLAIPSRAARLAWQVFTAHVRPGTLPSGRAGTPAGIPPPPAPIRPQRAAAREPLPSASPAAMRHLSALFLLTSARRITAGLRSGRPVADVLATEHRYAKAHRQAQTDRRRAAEQARAAAETSRKRTGQPLVRWVYGPDPAPCTPIAGVYCKDLDGVIFPISNPPQGTLPGARHPRCRCRAAPVTTSARGR